MGFFKSLNELNKVGNEINKDWDPGQQMRDGMAQMQAAQQMMADSTEAANLSMTGTDATASVVSAAQTGAMINYQPAMEISLTVFPAAGMPYPATVQTIVPQHQLMYTAPGTKLAVKVDPAAPEKVWIDWARTATGQV
ncbi:MAG: hypothetical protein V9E83_06900 [Baekduia sp.]